MEVSFCPVVIFKIQDKPLYSIPDEEWDVEQFTLLSRMNEFVIKLYWVQITECEDELKEINRQIVFSKRMFFDVNDVIHFGLNWLLIL